jgi:ATP-dependent helicase HrpA
MWRMIPGGEGRASNGALRRFCKTHFLSFLRIREWRDIHRQLEESIPSPTRAGRAGAGEELQQGTSGTRKKDKGGEGDVFECDYAGIHRSILSGLLAQVAQRQERNRYKAAGNRLATLFPGSHLFERQERFKKGQASAKNGEGKGSKKSRQPEWIMAAEIVETSQVFARSVAGVDPMWVVELGAHLCESRFAEPAWNARAERVLVSERVFLHGLEVVRKRTDYGKVNLAHATELFIRGALVEEEARLPFRFFEENRRTREKVETALTRVRHHQAQDLDEATYRFYSQRIEGVSSVHDLHRVFGDRFRRDSAFCLLREEDLLGGTEAGFDAALFPDAVVLGNTALPLSYAFDPGEDVDGVTIRVPLPVAAQLTAGQVQWMVPGLREEQISLLLRALPKVLRRAFMPIDVRAAEVAREFDPGRGDFLTALAEFLTRKYRIHVRRSDWPERVLPSHLCPRVEVVDHSASPLAAGRDLSEIHQKLETHEHRSNAWNRVACEWEKSGLTEWSFGDLPASVFVEEVAGVPLRAYPGIKVDGESVGIRLFRKPTEAEDASVQGIRKLVELGLSKDMVGLRKELLQTARRLDSGKRQGGGLRGGLQNLSSQLQAVSASYDPEAFQENAVQRLLEHAFAWVPVHPLERDRFTEFLETGRRALPGLVSQLGERVRQILALKEAIKAQGKRYPGIDADLERLVPARFLERTPLGRLEHVVRYLKTVQIRAERAALKPAKDAERALQVAFFEGWAGRVPQAEHERFRWLLEEFRVSIFAQELGTAESVSASKLKSLGSW